jgi:hypothetical protein
MLADNGRILSPAEVFDELQVREDEAAQWARKNKKIFRHPVEAEALILAEIVGKFPDTVKWKTKLDADPWLAAFALHHKRVQAGELISTEQMIVIAEDDRALRHLCDQYSLRKETLVQMLLAEGFMTLAAP